MAMTFLCPVCEDTRYEEWDGLFFCFTCSTQSEDILIKEQEQDVFRTPVKKSQLIGPAKPMGQSTSMMEFGRPWTIYEAYQCIILAQCDALIGLGAKQDLKDVVYLFWANYLAKLKVAFCEPEQLVPDVVLKFGFGRQRELHRGTIDKPYNMKRNTTVLQALKEVTEEENYEEEDPLPFVDDLTSAPFGVLISPEWMDLEKTLVFCYIGLRVTNPEILPSQLVRWAFEGKVPFLSTSHLLDADMQLFGEDGKLFKRVTLKTENLYQVANRLTLFLQVRHIPDRKIDSMLQQLLELLHLPGELVNVCMRLHEKVPYTTSSKATFDKRIDFGAMQYIAFALKIIFGLDDKTERKISKHSTEMQNLLGSEANLFVWSEWKAYHMMKKVTEFDPVENARSHKLCRLEHVDELLNCYNNNSFKKRRRKRDWMKDYDKRDKSIDIQLALGKALERCQSGEEHKKIKSTVDDNAGGRFRESTLAHIIDPVTFENDYKELISECEDHWKKQCKRMRKIQKKLMYGKFNVMDEQAMYESRPQSYLWMIELLSKAIGFQTLALDSALIKLQNAYENS